jgi:hypothetical protein
MKENQNIEYKQSWRDEYLKWICGFANADGGTLIIGNQAGVTAPELRYESAALWVNFKFFNFCNYSRAGRNFGRNVGEKDGENVGENHRTYDEIP